jgi:quercetin dioxygenase-like cupin family protein
MDITTRDEALRGEPMDPSHFTGATTARPVHRTAEPHTVGVAVVRFEAGARNHWHRHAGGQVLHVVDGEGYVQARGEQPRRIGVGDIVATPPGEEHWHGAGPASAMAHVAVTIGQTTWLEPSELEPA